MATGQDAGMPDAWAAYMLTIASGLSTGLGGLIVVVMGVPSASRVGMMQGFAAGMMIAVSLVELIGPALLVVGYQSALAFFLLGVVFMYLITDMIPSLEPSAHKTGEAEAFWHAGIVTAIGISIHNFPEGIAVFLSSVKAVEYGLVLAIAIALHNIPEGIAVAAPIYKSTQSARQAVWVATASGLFEPLGALMAGWFLRPYVTDNILNALYCGVSGVMVCMSVKELIPVSLQHSGRENTIAALAMGTSTSLILGRLFEHQ